VKLLVRASLELSGSRRELDSGLIPHAPLKIFLTLFIPALPQDNKFKSLSILFDFETKVEVNGEDQFLGVVQLLDSEATW